jgi:hypothetical protein
MCSELRWKLYSKHVRFQVLAAGSMKITALWDVASCSFGVDRRFRGAYCLHHQGDESFITLIMEAVRPLKRRSTPTRLHGATS